MKMKTDNIVRIGFFLALAIGGLAIQTVLPESNYWLLILTDVFVLAIFALSYNLLYGYTGLLSFGHALFFGGAAYTIGILAMHLDWGYFTSIPVAVVVVLALAITTGVAALRLTGVYFAMVTLAIAQLAFVFAESHSQLTGGSDGITGVQIPDLVGISFTDPIVVYYVTLSSLALVYLLFLRVVSSPYGRILQGIRDNEERMEMLGVNTYWYKLSVWTFSGLFTGLAGALYLLTFPFVDTSLLHWSTTGDILIITLIGGSGAFSGPVIGAFFFVLLEETVRSYTEAWLLVLGVIFIMLVLFYPGGIVEFRDSLREGKIDGVRGWFRDDEDR